MVPEPVVTVIVPGRDIAPYAQEAIDSLRAQTQPRFRAVLVDDGSVDATRDIFASATRQDARFELIRHETSRGLGAARNVALSTVRTPYVAFLDADDVAMPRMLERSIATLEHSGSDIVVGGYVRLRLEADGWNSGAVQPWVAASTTPARTAATLDSHPQVVGNIVAWSKVSRLALWHRTGAQFPEGVLYEDQRVTQQLYVAAHGIDTIEDVLVQWRIRAQGASITQREADPAVLRDCLLQMRAGLDVLQTASAAAFAARTTQILRMDLRRLAEVATDTASRTLLGDFARSLAPTSADLALQTQSPANPTDPAAPSVAQVYAEVSAW